MLAVAGKPVFHSLSPELFRIWGHNYTRIAAESEKDILQIALSHNLSGINITSPFKKSMVAYLQFISDTLPYSRYDTLFSQSDPHPKPLPMGEGDMESKSDSQSPRLCQKHHNSAKYRTSVATSFNSWYEVSVLFTNIYKYFLPKSEFGKEMLNDNFYTVSPICESNNINTLVFSDKEIHTYNTDVFAVIEFLSKNSNKRMLLIGAGDVAEIILDICHKYAIDVYIYNRTETKLIALKQSYSFETVAKSKLSEEIKKADILFNISPVWEEDVFEIISKNISKNHIIADAIYHKSPFEKINIKPDYSGLDWLLTQGKNAHELFFAPLIDDSLASDNIKKRLKRNNPNNFILTGFMGSGKTTIGKTLAYKLGYDFIDTDELVEQKEKLSISEIFKKFGDNYFRKVETEIISELNEKNCIIATGGGALINNSEKLKSLGEIIYLYCDFNICIERIKNSDRPLIKSHNIQKLYDERKFIYLENSDLVINSGIDKDAVTERLYREIDYAFRH
jgi:shikimate kinase/shikimate 5-dehydrogenase